MPLAALGIVAATLIGWAEITVTPVRGDRAASAWRQTVGALTRPSDFTTETLKRLDLEPRFRRDPEATIQVIERLAANRPEPELVYALAELSWIEGRRIEGRRIERRRGVSALERYVDTAAYAWDFLTDPELAAGRQPSDPRYSWAGHLYNGALDHLIRAAKKEGRIQPGDTIKLTIHGRELAMPVRLQDSPWAASDIHELLMAADFEVAGLDSRLPQYGLGVPLIGVRRGEKGDQAADRYFPPETAFPMTAVLRPASRLRGSNADEERRCVLDLVDPIQYRAVYGLAIESDITTPLAYMWSRTDLSRYRWTGLLRPGEAIGRAGLMLLRPYEPDKIPVVMVHGLASSPLAWIPMLNELLRDPTIQSKYQFLLYVYPTGVPIPIAASGLRDALIDAQKSFDQPGRTPEREFDRMVLLGHSMGGLLSHAMAVDDGNEFWQLWTDRPFDDIVGSDEVRQELSHYTFFQALPFVKRVVFLATPHRGSEYSRRPVGRISSSLISEPDTYSKLLHRLVKDNPHAFPRQFRHLPTSIDDLDPDSEILGALLRMKSPEGVQFHSIIGSLRPGGVQHTTDGVVPYRSSHLDGVPELVVRSDHGVQKSPEAIREVRRILYLHIGLQPARLAGPKESGPRS